MRWVVLALKVVLGAVAIAIVAVAFAMNALFWFRLYASDEWSRWLYVAFSIACGSAKIGIPSLLAAQAMRWRDAKGLVIVWCVAFSFDLWSGIGYNSQTQGNVTAESQQHTAQRTKLQADVVELDRKLAQIPATARAAGPVRAEVTKAAAEAGRCTGRNADSDACQRLFKLQTELANADERQRLEIEAAPLRRQLADTPAGRDAAAHLTAVAKGLKSVGANVAPETLGYLWTGLLLLLIELCPSAVFAYVFRPAPAPPVRLERPKAPAAARQSHSAPAGLRPAADVLALLRSAQAGVDGWIGPATQRAMGDMIGVSGAEVNRQIADLVARKVVAKRAGRSGTYLKFVSPARSLSIIRSTG